PRELCEAMRRLERRDEAQLKIANQRVRISRSRQRSIANEPMPRIIRRNRALQIDSRRVDRDQNEARIRAVVDGLRERVADPEAQRLLHTLIQIHKQSVVSRVPPGIGFEENSELGIAKTGNGDSSIEQTRMTRSEGPERSIVGCAPFGRARSVRLIDVEEAAEMNAANSQIRRAERRALRRLN